MSFPFVRACVCCILGVLATLDSPMAAAENGLTVFGGWRASSGFEDSNSGQKVRIRDGGAVSLALDFTYDESKQIEIFGSYQNTSMTVTPTGGTTSERVAL